VRVHDDFARITARASMVVDDFGVVDAALGEGVAEAMEIYKGAIGDLA
jgi:hypothetical protein